MGSSTFKAEKEKAKLQRMRMKGPSKRVYYFGVSNKIPSTLIANYIALEIKLLHFLRL